ncbi:MAG: RNA polymerase sigma factor [Proteobacteria bacterium]|jgi:RNA polymerase sigma-70 factor (ECF subfamily)|nr:RNA polymerase sigma factor [Pseudomonadota bacterium]
MQSYQNWKANEQLLTEAVELLEAVRVDVGELEKILSKAQSGDPEASEYWPILVKAFLEGYLNKFGFQAGLNHQEKEEVMQNVLMQLTRNLRGSFGQAMEIGRNTRGWLVTILKNAIIDRQRKTIKNKKTKSLTLDFDDDHPKSSEPNPHDVMSRMETAEKVRSAIASLDPIHQEVLIMFYQNGMKYDDIAQTLHIPPGTVKSRIAAAKDRLRKKIEEI